MSQKIYLNLLILCSILSQGILGTFLEDNHNNSSNLYSRKKRTVDHADATFISKILKNGIKICTGVIVSPKHILATEMCVCDRTARYTVESGALDISPTQIHYIEDIHREGYSECLVLLVIRPSISFVDPYLNRQMPFYEGNVSPHLPHLNSIAWDSTDQVQTMTHVPIIGRERLSSIPADQICTGTMSGKRRLTINAGDIGSALAVGYHLVGVFVRPGGICDIFIRVNVGSSHYAWIMQYIHPYVQNQMNGQHRHNHT